MSTKLRELTLTDLKTCLEDLLSVRKAALHAVKVGAIYEPLLQKKRVAMGALPTVEPSGRAFVDDLDEADGDGGDAQKAGLDRPHGIAVATDGTLYIADSNNHRVRRVSPR